MIYVNSYPGFDPTGATDSRAAIMLAIADVPVRGKLIFPVGCTFSLSQPVSIERGDIEIEGNNSRCIVDAPSFTTNDGAFEIGDKSPAALPAANVTANVIFGATYIDVDNGALFSAGDRISICSNEPAVGQDAVSGYTPRTRGEFLLCTQVVVNRVYLSGQTLEGYTLGTGDIVSLARVVKGARIVKLLRHDVIRNVAIRNMIFHGEGGGGGETPASIDFQAGAQAISLDHVEGWVLDNCEFRDHARFAVVPRGCLKGLVTHCRFMGRDLSANAGVYQSIWFTPIYVECSDGVIITDCHIENSHVGFDGDSTNTGLLPYCRNILFANNIMHNCRAAVGGHAVDRARFINLTASGCRTGGSFRGTNVEYIDCDFGHLGSDGVTLSIGGVTSQNHGTYANSGNVTVRNVRGRGGRGGMVVKGSVERLVVDGLFVRDYDGLDDDGAVEGAHGIEIYARRIGSLQVVNCDLDGSSRGTDQSVGINIKNHSGLLRECGDIDIRNNRIHGHFVDIIVPGTSDWNAPLPSLRIDQNRLSLTGSSSVVLGRNNAVSIDQNGYFSEYVSVENNVFIDRTMAETIVIRAPANHVALPSMEGNQWSNYNPKVARYITGALGPAVLGNFSVGQCVERTDVPARWRCIKPGTHAAAIVKAGAIAAGSSTVAITSTPLLALPGSWLNIAGAGSSGATLKAKVLNVNASGTTIKLDRSASSGVTGSTIAWAAPEFAAI